MPNGALLFTVFCLIVSYNEVYFHEKSAACFHFFSSFALLLPLFSLTSADAYEDFTLDAKAGLLIEADTGEILYEKNRPSGELPRVAHKG